MILKFSVNKAGPTNLAGGRFSMLIVARLACVLIQISVSYSLTPKFAIVGAGVGGSFAADRLRILSGSAPVQIDVFEASERAGGRAMSFDFEGEVSFNHASCFIYSTSDLCCIRFSIIISARLK